MSTATHTDEARSTNPDLPRREEIAEQLRSLLASPTFHGSKRCQQFLEYVCDKSLAGEIGALKERSIAIDVFGRHLDEEGHAEDTIVRVSAREVRKRLAQYYVTPEGAAAAILIELPSGSYAPRFHYTRLPEPKILQTAQTVPEPIDSEPQETLPGSRCLHSSSIGSNRCGRPMEHHRSARGRFSELLGSGLSFLRTASDWRRTSYCLSTFTSRRDAQRQAARTVFPVSCSTSS